MSEDTETLLTANTEEADGNVQQTDSSPETTEAVTEAAESKASDAVEPEGKEEQQVLLSHMKYSTYLMILI